VVVALGEGRYGRVERRFGEQVVRCGHAASMARPQSSSSSSSWL
jgi:hypothetical protein